MRTEDSTSNIIAAALARQPRPRRRREPEGEGGTPLPNPPNNYVAKARRPGGKPGNQNARTHGLRSAAGLARRAEVRGLIEQTHVLIRELNELAKQAHTEQAAPDPENPL